MAKIKQVFLNKEENIRYHEMVEERERAARIYEQRGHSRKEVKELTVEQKQAEVAGKYGVPAEWVKVDLFKVQQESISQPWAFDCE